MAAAQAGSATHRRRAVTLPGGGRARRRSTVVGGALGAAVLVAMAATTTVVAADDEGAASVGREVFDARQYAVERYESDVVPAIEENAVEITELLPALIADPDATGESLGHRSGVGSPFSFAVTGTGVAGTLDGSLLPVTIDGLPGDVTVALQVGPAINGTALRDATGLISFGDFLNQMEYAEAATELNTMVKESVLADLDPAAAQGRTVSFTGAMTYGPNTAYLQITPVELEVEE